MNGEAARVKQELIKKYKELWKTSADLRAVNKKLQEAKQDEDSCTDTINALLTPGMFTGEVLRQVDEDKFIVKESTGSRLMVNRKRSIKPERLTVGTRVALEVLTHTIVKVLPRAVDPQVYQMQTSENDKPVSFQEIGGLQEQMRSLREVVELPITNPELFSRVGIKAPKGVLLYGPPGTGKTLLAKAIASNLDASFLKIVASSIVDKYIGESSRIIREMFDFARTHEPCIIFFDEIDAIAGKRIEGSSSDREVQRTLMELLNQLDGFDQIGRVKVIMATNRPDTLDPALLRPGRLDRKIEIPLPNEEARHDVIRIHASKIKKDGDIDYESIVKLSEGFNNADLRNVCTEAGMFAIRADRRFVTNDDFNKAVRKVAEAKKLEGQVHAYSEQ